jgi:H+/Cl- antiporter ClcA
MKFLKIIIGALATGVLVAFTYFVFEAVVRNAIDYVWLTSLDTDNKRLVMVALTIVLGLAFFIAQHIWDRKAEESTEEALGGTPSPTIMNFIKVLFIGFLSLFAGASLGPEAILIPACLIVGSYIGKKISNDDKQVAKLLGAAGFVALFVSFFSSFWASLLGLYLLKVESGAKLKPVIIIVAAITSAATFATLQVIEAPKYFTLPPHSWNISLESLAVLIGLLIAGFIYTNFLELISKIVEYARSKNKKATWWQHAVIASTGLAIIYLAGGPLIEFTGNESIMPIFEQASTLGLLGLLWIIIAKSSAIAWSKAMGYWGGMIFPTVFVAAALTAIAQFAVPELSAPVGIAVVLVGAFYANSKSHTLF